MSELTLIKGGKPAVRSASSAAATEHPANDPTITAPRKCIEDLIREFNELKEMWRDTKSTINRML